MRGSFRIQTGSGTVYVLHLDSPKTIVRLVNEATPASPYKGIPTAELRRDGEAVELLGIVTLMLGRPAQLILNLRRDGVPTLRTTTEVISITSLGAERAGS